MMTPRDIVVTRAGLRFMGRRFPCTIGRGGVRGDKREGDGATPLGTHRIVGLLYRPDRLSRPTDWAVPLRPFDGWCDDPVHEDYNLMIRRPFAASHERLCRADPMYDIILITDWNWPRAEKGKGSAIFIHTWRRPLSPTAGCVALDARPLRWIVQRIGYGTRLFIR